MDQPSPPLRVYAMDTHGYGPCNLIEEKGAASCSIVPMASTRESFVSPATKVDATTPEMRIDATPTQGDSSPNSIEQNGAVLPAIVPKSVNHGSSDVMEDRTGTAGALTCQANCRHRSSAKIVNDCKNTTMMTPNDGSAMENDTIDTPRRPLHAPEMTLRRTPSVGFSSTVNEILDGGDTIDAKPKRRGSPFGLTLSAFRRPENTVRIACMDTTRKITDEYDFDAPECRVLGHGASSTVRLAVRRKDGVPVAVKSVAKHEALRFRKMRHGARRHLDEWDLLQSLNDNPHVVSLLDVYETDDEIQLVLEYCQGGELYDVIHAKRREALTSPDKAYSFSESTAAKIVLQMLKVLTELSSRGIVHRDVKPENILLLSSSLEGSDICAKLSDFGTSRELHPEIDSDSCSSDGEASPLTPQSRKRAYSAVGSNFYTAPEVNAGHGYDTAVDVYSLGVTLYVLLCGFPPSFATNEDDDDVVTFPSLHWSHVSEDAKNLIRKMLVSEASGRITAAQALQDSWIVRHTQAPVQATSVYSPRPVVDMELVRSRLCRGLVDSDSDEDEEIDACSQERLQKRRKLEEQEPNLIEAMVGLYEGLESAAVSATAAAAGVMMNDEDDVRVVEEMDERVADSPRVASPAFESSFTALSV